MGGGGDPTALYNLLDRGGVLTQLGDRYRYFVSEWNTFSCADRANVAATIADHKAMLAAFAGSPEIVAATSFIWLSGGEHNKNVIALNDPLRTWHERAGAVLNAGATWPSAKWHWKETPVDPLDLDVGEGVWRRMAELGDAPASDELYLSEPGKQVSLTIGLSGRLYVCTERNGWAIQVYEPR
jgi:hypothetical protein